MPYNPKYHHRRSIRLKDYDYSTPNWYYVTICTQNKKCLFGEVINGKMILNECGKIVEDELLKTKEIRKNVDLDYYVIMPNHLHAIIIIKYQLKSTNENGRGELQFSTANKFISPSQTIGAIVRGFKSAATNRINQARNTPNYKIWQKNYYEHILRNEKDLYFTRNYIKLNPFKWELEEYYKV